MKMRWNSLVKQYNFHLIHIFLNAERDFRRGRKDKTSEKERNVFWSLNLFFRSKVLSESKECNCERQGDVFNNF